MAHGPGPILRLLCPQVLVRSPGFLLVLGVLGRAPGVPGPESWPAAGPMGVGAGRPRRRCLLRLGDCGIGKGWVLSKVWV